MIMATRKSKKTTSKDVKSAAEGAIANLKQIATTLPIDDTLQENQLAATRVSNRVPLDAILIAVGLLNDDPKQFPQFDAADAQAAIDYEQALLPVAAAATVLAKRITRSVQKRRSTTAHQTLAFYQVVKGTTRLGATEETRTKVKQMSKLFTTKTKSRETDVTQKEAGSMVKTRRSEKKQAVAQQKATEASNEAAIAAAQATLDAAVAAGTVPAAPAVAGGATPGTVVVPVAAPVTAPVAGSSGH